MTDLQFKNLTSADKRRKIITCSETGESHGVRSVIRRHFVWMVKELNGDQAEGFRPYLYILKERNTKDQKERFFCKLKGSIYLAHKGRPFLIVFMHTLKIDLIATAKSGKI